MDNFLKRENETAFEWKLRLAKLKLIDKIDLDWQEIVNILGLDCSADHFRKVSYGLIEYDNYLKDNGVMNRILSLSDFHIPFQLSIETFKDFIGQVDILQLNGDIVDMQSISRFPKIYRVSVMEEIILGRQYIIDLIEYIKPKRVVVNNGNHEKRFGAYLAKNLDSDILELMPDSSMDLILDTGFNHYDKRNKTKTWYEPLKNVFDNVEIEYTGDWKCKIGKTYFIHPSAYSGGMLKTTEKAINYFLRIDRDFDTISMAHVHKLGSYIQGNIYMFEQGCCCKTDELDYADGKLTYPQQKGFIYLCQNKQGNLIYDKTKLIELT